MTFELKPINPMDYPNWDDLILSTPNYSFFHSSFWARVLSESYSYTPTYFMLMNHERPLAIVPAMEVKSVLTGRRGVSLPFTDYCEPLLRGSFPFNEVMDNILRYGKEWGWRSLELRGGRAPSEKAIPSIHYFRHTLNLSPDTDLLFARFRESTRRNIKKGLSEGIEIRQDHSLESLRAFYRLNALTRQQHGLPPQPYSFFKKVHEHILSKGMGFVMLACFKDKVIAGGVFFHIGGKAIYKYSASDRRFWHLRPNNLVMWEAIRWCAQRGFREFCFGRTEMGNQGLRQFKSGWGVEERVISYYKYDMDQGTYVAEHEKMTPTHHRILRQIPIPLLKAVGSLLYRHMG
jgi:hypothetical protein